MRWRSLFCRGFGHNPEGPIAWARYESERFEPSIYKCRRCHALVSFLKAYPNGWHERNDAPELVSQLGVAIIKARGSWKPSPHHQQRNKYESDI